VFPENAYIWKLAGSVRARVYINETGGVDSVQIVEARPRRGIFEAAALEALRQVRYQPAEIAGRPVKSQKLIEVKFDPHERPDEKG
jgi:protein TonB